MKGNVGISPSAMFVALASLRGVRPPIWALWLAIVFVCSGATCIPKRPNAEFAPKPMFAGPPTQEQLFEVINRSRSIQSLQSNFVTVNPNRMRNLDASLVWVRERKFKLSGGISRMLGNNFEVGSNDQYFWMSVRDGMRPQLFFARHDEFESQSTRRILPVSPLWILEALGISEIDPYRVLGPAVNRPDGMLELSTMAPTATGTYTRTLVIDPKFGYTRQVLLRDPSGRLVASATQSEHNYYASAGLSLPHKVLMQLVPVMDPPTEIDVTIGGYVINGLDLQQSASGFELPNQNGYEVVNLVQFNQGLPQAVTPVQVAPPLPPAVPPTAYRGVPWDNSVIR